jgi:hypothetical protein
MSKRKNKPWHAAMLYKTRFNKLLLHPLIALFTTGNNRVIDGDRKDRRLEVLDVIIICIKTMIGPQRPFSLNDCDQKLQLIVVYVFCKTDDFV